MTQDQTRLLGIEFERRIQTLFPDTTINKLDTDTIYSFLNEYQMRYVKQLILANSQTNVESNTAISSKISETLKTLLRKTRLGISDSDRFNDQYSNVFKLPNDYFVYVRSSSFVDKTYKSIHKSTKFLNVGNILISQLDANSVINNYYDSNKIIRNPLVLIENNTLKVIHDKYTHLDGVLLTYYCQPYSFNVINYNDSDTSANAVHSYCELPFNCFEELIDGAVQIYVAYRTGANINKQPRREQLDNSTNKNTEQ